MNISVVVVAHNEEKNIARCLDSLVNQTITPQEIIVVCHNCTDTTYTTASTYSKVTALNYSGPEGVPYARMYGHAQAHGTLIACIDGDAYADKNWLQQLTHPFTNESVLIVGGTTILTNNLWSRITTWWQFAINRVVLRKSDSQFVWGSNFAYRKNIFDALGGWQAIIDLRQKLQLHFWAEDLLISLVLQTKGVLRFALRAYVYTTIPAWKNNPATAPIREWNEDNAKAFTYFQK